MSKLFKKSLAFCVAIAMVFTLFAGTISVNAEDAEETLTVNLVVDNTRVAADAAQAVLPVHVTCSADTSINVLRLVITTTAGKVSNVVSAAATEDYTIYYNGDYALLNAGQTVEDLGGFNAAELLVTVDLNEGLTEEAYAITIDARSENASDANENALKISYETAYILLPHTHTMSETYSYDDNGHWLACTSEFCDVVGGYTTEVAEHVWENNGDAVAPDCVDTLEQPVICNICGATKTVNVDPVGHDYEYTNNGETHSAVCKNNAEHVITDEAHNYVDGKCVCGAEEVTECTHAYDAADNVNYVKFIETGIVHYEICTLCGEEVALSVDDSADAVVVAAKALDQTSYDAINVTAAGTYTIDIEDGTNLRYAYIKGDKVVAISNIANMNDNSVTAGANGENPFHVTYAGGTATFTVDFPGVFIAFVPKEASKLPAATTSIGMSNSFDLGSSIAINFRINKTNLANFEEVYALIDHDAYTLNESTPIVDKRIEIANPDDTANTLYYFQYPIAASQMADDVTCSYYGVLDGVDYLIRQQAQYSFVHYAARTNNVGYKGTDSAFKTLLSTMLTYGAVAQKAFGYRTDRLCTSFDDVSAYLAENPAMATVAKEDIVKVDQGAKYLQTASADRICAFQGGLNCESTVEIYYRVSLQKFYTNGYTDADLDKLSFVISYIEPSKDETAKDFTTETLTIKDAYKVDKDNKYYFFAANKIPASMMASESHIDVYYDGVWQAQMTYSINFYNYTMYDSATLMKGDASQATLGDLCKAIVTYGKNAREYFGINN